MAGFKTICESNQKLFLLIKTAIEREIESQEIYKEAMIHCPDPVLLPVLEKLYAQEIMHEKKLQNIYKRLRQSFDTDGRPVAGRKKRVAASK
jgi:rubrerythrin